MEHSFGFLQDKLKQFLQAVIDPFFCWVVKIQFSLVWWLILSIKASEHKDGLIQTDRPYFSIIGGPCITLSLPSHTHFEVHCVGEIILGSRLSKLWGWQHKVGRHKKLFSFARFEASGDGALVLIQIFHIWVKVTLSKMLAYSFVSVSINIQLGL